MTFLRLAGFTMTMLALFLPQTGRAEIQSYMIDPYFSQAIILVPHYQVTRTGGLLGGLTGTIEVDPETMSSWTMDVTIPVSTFISTHPPRTEAVKGAMLLDAVAYPEIRFSCKSVEKKGNEYAASGTITIRGISKDVTFPMVVKGPRIDPFGNTRIGLDGSFSVDRQDFAMEFDRKLPNGDPVVGDQVDIQFQVEGIRGTRGMKAPEEMQKTPEEAQSNGK